MEMFHRHGFIFYQRVKHFPLQFLGNGIIETFNKETGFVRKKGEVVAVGMFSTIISEREGYWVESELELFCSGVLNKEGLFISHNSYREAVQSASQHMRR